MTIWAKLGLHAIVSPQRRTGFIFTLLVHYFCSANICNAQDGFQWLTMCDNSRHGPNGSVDDIHVWDQDGEGPQSPVLVVGGSFSTIFTQVGSKEDTPQELEETEASNIAIFDPANRTWRPVGTGLDGSVGAIASLSNTTLVAGGRFASADGLILNGIASWDTKSWTSLGEGVKFKHGPADVRALVVLTNGDLIAGGRFTTAGSVEANHIARWDGNEWFSLGKGMLDSFASVSALAVLPNGDLIAGGNFVVAGRPVVNNIARWNGSTWSPLQPAAEAGDSPWLSAPPGVAGGVFALAALSNGDLVAGGAFASAGRKELNHIGLWNGKEWTSLGSGVDDSVHAIGVLPNGDIVAAGGFEHAGELDTDRIARWNGNKWSSLGRGLDGGVSAIAITPNGDLAAGGSFMHADGVPSRYFALYTATASTEEQKQSGKEAGGHENEFGEPVLDAKALEDLRKRFEHARAAYAKESERYSREMMRAREASQALGRLPYVDPIDPQVIIDLDYYKMEYDRQKKRARK